MSGLAIKAKAPSSRHCLVIENLLGETTPAWADGTARTSVRQKHNNIPVTVDN